jgi:hypothetical protein
VRRAAVEIIALHLPIVGFLNNAGIRQAAPHDERAGLGHDVRHEPLRPIRVDKSAQPHLPDGTNVVFVASAVEDPPGQSM